MDPLVVYYTRTGTTLTVAQAIAERLHRSTVERITPIRSRRYLNWLARSFVPYSTVPIEAIEHDPRDYDAVFVGTPKWTLSCPPVTAYLDRTRFDGVDVGLFVTFGGFDEARYARGLETRLRAAGAASVTTGLFKREHVDDGEIYRDVASLVAAVRDGNTDR